MIALDPVAGKELRGVSRRWQTYVGRVIYVGLTGYILYSYWKEAWNRGGPRMAAEVNIAQMARLGREIFLRCEWVSLVLTSLAAVIGGADMISREIRNDTLGLLFLTPLTPHQVVFGKWKGAMTIALSLYLCSVPVLGISVYLGGVAALDLLRSASLTLGLAAIAAALAIFFSARLKSAGASVAASIPAVFLAFTLMGLADVLGKVFFEMFYDTRTVLHAGGIATTLLAIAVTTWFLDRAVRHLQERTGAIPGPAELAREKRALALDEVREKRTTPQRRILRTWRAVWEESPLLWKEFTLRPALRIREEWRARGYVSLFLLFVVTWLASDTSRSSVYIHLWGLFFTAVALAAGCMLFAPEKEGRQWLLLLSTPVTPVQIIRAKLLCGLIFPEAMGLIILYLLVLGSWMGFQRMETIAAVGGTATLFILFAYALAAAASLRARSARGAFLFAGGVVAFLVAVPPLLSAAVRPLRLVRGFYWGELWSWFEALDPLTVLDSFELSRRYPGPIPPLTYERALRFVTLYLPATILLPLDMVVRFRRIVSRA